MQRSTIQAAAIAAIVLFLVSLSVTIVPAGHVGVKDFFGKVSDRVLQLAASSEVAHDLSKSTNAKIVLLGDKSGLRIILSEK